MRRRVFVSQGAGGIFGHKTLEGRECSQTFSQREFHSPSKMEIQMSNETTETAEPTNVTSLPAYQETKVLTLKVEALKFENNRLVNQVIAMEKDQGVSYAAAYDQRDAAEDRAKALAAELAAEKAKSFKLMAGLAVTVVVAIATNVIRSLR